MCLLLFQFAGNSRTDSTKKVKHSVFLEAGGTCGYGSVNYEINIYKKKYFILNGRVGLSTYHIHDFSNKLNPDILLPLMAQVCYGKTHRLDIGIGQTIASIIKAGDMNLKPARYINFHSVFTLGYRYQKQSGGFLFRAAYTPILEFNKYLRHWAGLSFGYSF